MATPYLANEEMQYFLYRVNRSDIWYLHFIFEAYDGIGTVSTVDSREGIVQVGIPSSRIDEALKLLEEICHEIRIEPLASV